MKLIRAGEPGEERPGIINSNGEWLDVSGFGEDYDERFLGGDGLQRLSAWLKRHAGSCPRMPKDTRLGPPIRLSDEISTFRS